MDGNRLTITVEETAARLGISRGLAYEQVRLGTIPSLRLGRRLLVPVHALEEMLKNLTKGETPVHDQDSDTAA